MVGRGYGVYGVCWFGPGWSGLWCLWCLMAWTWVVQAMVSMVPARLELGGRGYSVSGVWCGRAMAPMVSDGLDLGGRGYGVYGV